MPYNQFICPDGQRTAISDCLSTCRLASDFEGGRCLSKRTLLAMSEQREWNGVPSATMLLNGTRESFLKIKKEYAIDPQQVVFAIFGTGCHMYLEQFITSDKMSAEVRLQDPTGTYSGQYDCYDEKEKILYDVKTYGSYKTAKVMGLQKRKEPILDEHGNQRKYKNGKKMYRVWFEVGHRSNFEVAVQLNAYRIMLENIGKQVDKMLVEVFTRDAGTFSATDRGITTNAQLLRVNHISDRWIQRYFLTKARQLISSLKKNELPEPCSYRERWGGQKCKGYCAVWEFCDVGRALRNAKKNQ